MFSCAIHPLVQALAQHARESAHNSGQGLTLFYLDDGILCGDARAVAEELQMVQQIGSRLGLALKLSKCELIVPAGRDATTGDLDSLFPRALLVDSVTGANRVAWEPNFEFLGAPVGSDAFCATRTRDRVQQAIQTIVAIGALCDPQIGLCLLCTCAGFCKLV